jgi:hypothetical protein
MDRKLAGLLGAAAAVTTLASVQAAPTSTSQLPEAASYWDLLDPIANPIPQLKRGWLNLKGLKGRDWLRFRPRSVTITIIITDGITTIIIITTITIITTTKPYKEKGAFGRTSLFPACLGAS